MQIPADANSPLARIYTNAALLTSSSGYPDDEKERAEYILTFLYANILRTYSSIQTRIDTIFTNGRYNCVSSAVLYMIFCEYAQINTSGVITRDHTFVTAHINEEDIDIETTNRYGFDPGNRREFHDQFGRLTGFAYVPARNYRDRQTISKLELISIILNNRISELENNGRWADAVPLAIDRAALLYGSSLNMPEAGEVNGTHANLFPDPRIDLMDRLFNYGASLLRANREEDCLLWAAAASSVYPDEERWQEFIYTSVNNRIARFLRDRRLTDAKNFLENNKNIINEENYAQLDSVIIDTDLLERANRITGISDGEAVISAVLQARNSGRINTQRTAEILTFAIQKTASALSAAPARDWRAAITFIENSISSYGTNRELEQSLQSYKSNLAADYHNRFAAEWNRRNFDEAERILNEGLAEFPANRQLLSDREIVDRQRGR